MVKKYYSIGEMAKLNYISTHTLRYYDKIGILSPSYVDEKTGYRYYNHEDFLFLDTIQYQKLFNMSLKEIKEQFDDRNIDNTIEVYEKQLLKIKEQLTALTDIEKRINHNIKNLTKYKDITGNELSIIEREYRYAIILNDSVENDEEYEVAIRKLSHKLYENNFRFMGDFIAIKDRNDIKNGLFSKSKIIGNLLQKTTNTKSYLTLNSGKYLQCHHVGKTELIGNTYKKMLNYIDSQGLKITGDIIEIYTVDLMDTRDPDEYVTIIEIPVV